MRAKWAIAAGLFCATSTMAQSPYGSVEFRWREVSLGVLPVVNGQQVTHLPAGAMSMAANAQPDWDAENLAWSSNASDASFTLILEARVTRAPGNSDLRGLNGMGLHIRSNIPRAAGSFAGTTDGLSPNFPSGRVANAVDASTTSYMGLKSLGADYKDLPSVINSSTPGYTGSTSPYVIMRAQYNTIAQALPGTRNDYGDLGIFAPFRRVADFDSQNQSAIGVVNRGDDPHTGISNILIGANGSLLSGMVGPISVQRQGPYHMSNSLDGPAGNTSEFYGLDNWVPLYISTLNLTDLTALPAGPLTVSVEIANSSSEFSNIVGIRGIQNAEGQDSWVIDNAGAASFVIVPAPNALSVLVLGSIAAVRRRRVESRLSPADQPVCP